LTQRCYISHALLKTSLTPLHLLLLSHHSRLVGLWFAEKVDSSNSRTAHLPLVKGSLLGTDETHHSLCLAVHETRIEFVCFLFCFFFRDRRLKLGSVPKKKAELNFFSAVPEEKQWTLFNSSRTPDFDVHFHRIEKWTGPLHLSNSPRSLGTPASPTHFGLCCS